MKPVLSLITGTLLAVSGTLAAAGASTAAQASPAAPAATALSPPPRRRGRGGSSQHMSLNCEYSSLCRGGRSGECSVRIRRARQPSALFCSNKPGPQAPDAEYNHRCPAFRPGPQHAGQVLPVPAQRHVLVRDGAGDYAVLPEQISTCPASSDSNITSGGIAELTTLLPGAAVHLARLGSLVDRGCGRVRADAIRPAGAWREHRRVRRPVTGTVQNPTLRRPGPAF
jgi:hypothetical protein